MRSSQDLRVRIECKGRQGRFEDGKPKRNDEMGWRESRIGKDGKDGEREARRLGVRCVVFCFAARRSCLINHVCAPFAASVSVKHTCAFLNGRNVRRAVAVRRQRHAVLRVSPSCA